jgi:HK97 family phage portal protein
MSGFEFIRDTVADREVYGNAFWVKRRVGGRMALVRVNPCYVTGTGGHPAAGPTLYTIDVGGGPVEVSPSQMVHFRDYNPEDVRVGSSVLEALASVIAEEKAASNHRRGFWRNSARHEGWIKRPKGSGHWSREQRREFRADWQEAMAGAENAGRVAILEDDMELHGGSFSPKEAEFIEGREWGLNMVATGFRIPLSVLSRGGTFTFASMKEFHIVVYVDTLGPRMAEIEKAINTQLVPDFNDPDLFVEFNIEEKLQGDFETQSEAMRRAIHVPYMSVNEARAIRNLPRVADPDFDRPAKLMTYEYATTPTAPRVIRSQPGLPEDADTQTPQEESAALAAELKELTNGHK